MFRHHIKRVVQYTWGVIQMLSCLRRGRNGLCNHHNDSHLVYVTYKAIRVRRIGKAPRHSFAAMGVDTFTREVQTLVLLDAGLRENQTKELHKNCE